MKKHNLYEGMTLKEVMKYEELNKLKQIYLDLLLQELEILAKKEIISFILKKSGVDIPNVDGKTSKKKID